MKKFFAKLGHFFQGVGRGLVKIEPTAAAIAARLDPKDAARITMAQEAVVAVKNSL